MARRESSPRDRSPYAGRWIARLQGKIVGQGGTPGAARRAAQADRPKEKPEISYVRSELNAILPPLLNRVRSLAPEAELYLVGGFLRDALLGKTSHDFDLVVAKGAIPLARRIAAALRADFYVLDEEFDAGRVIVTGANGIRDVLDFTSFRGPSITADLEARDFRINAIAMDLRTQVTLDPLQGAGDLRERRIRACSQHAFLDDPIRILRAVRLAAALGFKIERETRAAMKAAVGMLPRTSPERQRDELFRILEGPRPDASVRALEILGLLPHSLPELAVLKGVPQSAPHVHDVWEHTLSVLRHLDEILTLVLDGEVERANGIRASLLTLGIGRYRPQIAQYYAAEPNQERTRRGLLLLAALYHDAGKPLTQTQGEDNRIHFLGHERESADIAIHRARSLNLSNGETSRLEVIIRNHLRYGFLASPMEDKAEVPSRRAIYRFFRDAGECAVDLVLLGLADLAGTRGHVLGERAWKSWVDLARLLLQNLWERPEEIAKPPRLLDGHGLMRALGLDPGPLVGQLLEEIREAQAAGELTTREDAVGFARRRLKTNGREEAS